MEYIPSQLPNKEEVIINARNLWKALGQKRDVTHVEVMTSCVIQRVSSLCALPRLCSVDYQVPRTSWNLKTEFSLRKRIKMFSVHTTPKKFENAIITGQFIRIYVWGKLGQESHMIIVVSRFRKASFSRYFLSNETQSKFLWFEECFQWRFRRAA